MAHAAVPESEPGGSRRCPPAAAPSLQVGGITPLTTIDFPGRLAAVLYCQGCPWRCGYCHNPELLEVKAVAGMSWAQVLLFLEKRRGLVDGVVFSGGEPTLQAALPDALKQVRAMGFATALHTGGMYPERLAAVLPLLDWVGLDIKGPRQRYADITGARGSDARAWQSLQLLVRSGVAYECRTTWHEGLFSREELQTLEHDLVAEGVTHWTLQPCRTSPQETPRVTAPLPVGLGSRVKAFDVRGGG